MALNKTDSQLEQGTLRPPSEANSLLIRVVRNCPWNKCTFCPGYKGEKFSIRSLEEILLEIENIDSVIKKSVHTIFLQDADALVIPVDSLEKIIVHIKAVFPELKRITAYARSSTLAHRTIDELVRLKNAGLSRIHVGVESGCNDVLRLIKKGVTADKQLEGCLNVKSAGLELCCYIMPGLGGKEFSEINGIETGQLIAKIQPDHIRLRTLHVLEGTPLADDYLNGRFQPLNEEETVKEIRQLISLLKNTRTQIISDHRINLLFELQGKLPDDYNKLMAVIDKFLNLEPDKKELFIIGRNKKLIKKLDDIENEEVITQLSSIKNGYKKIIPVPANVLY